MTHVRGLSLVFVALVMILATCPAKADCVGYEVIGPLPCKGGCEWNQTLCTFGCTSGTCNSKGNTTECCGVPKNYAQIAEDGQGGCGEFCGDSRARLHSSVLHASPEHRAELLQGYTPGLVMLRTNLSYRPPLLVYVLNRNHSYEVVVDDRELVTTGGM